MSVSHTPTTCADTICHYFPSPTDTACLSMFLDTHISHPADNLADSRQHEIFTRLLSNLNRIEYGYFRISRPLQ